MNWFSVLRYENSRQPLLARNIYLRRLVYTGLITISILAIWVIIGMIGYHFLDDLPWIDAFVNTGMLVGGMGPINILTNPPAKIFAGFYAILSGVLFLSAFAVMMAPIFHRFIHKFHLETDEKSHKKKDE
jgi:hypothetical protein